MRRRRGGLVIRSMALSGGSGRRCSVGSTAAATSAESLIFDLVGSSYRPESAENGDGVLDRGLLDITGWKRRRCRVLPDVLAVLVERGRTHAAKLAAREGGLEQSPRLPRLARAGPTSVCSSSMKQMISPSLSVISPQDGLQSVLELAAYFEPATMPPDVDASGGAALEASGTSPARSLGKPLDDRGLADTPAHR